MVPKIFISFVILFAAFQAIIFSPSFFITGASFIFAWGIINSFYILKRWRLVLTPLLFLISAFIFYPLISKNIFNLEIFALIVSFIWGLFLYIDELKEVEPSKTNLNETALNSGARRPNKSFIFLTAFIWFSGLYGVYFNFNIPFWFIIIIIGVGLMFFSLELLRFNFFLSFLLTFLTVQLAWILAFLPLAYLTLGAFLLVFYFILVRIIKRYNAGSLRIGIILKELVLGGVLIGVLTLSVII